MSKPQICVIGIGKFGYKFGLSLVKSNYNVIGIDCHSENIKRAKEYFTQVYEADASNKKALEQIGFSDITHTLVSVGDSISASAMITMYLKELNIPNVWVKAINEDHSKLLKKIGADEIIVPEHIAARHLADRIHTPGMIQRLPFDPEMIIREFCVEKFSNKTLREIDLTNSANCQVLAIQKCNESSYCYLPKADDKLSRGDIIVVIGKEKSLSKINP